ncbi:hypothetical protein RUM43_004334 [Polyplax serrata]|uniref:Aromatic amino acid beta-eliminating lyase/threonine aldolase domain-containing protein n=1 Tax=Polyplax serrata TaxID=468196 RepID=A0AAN8SBS0_POLSC
MYNSLDNNYFANSKYSVVDLRSDTVSKPTKEMRISMFEAEVGDDVYGEDPTVNRLEKMASDIFKKEAGLFLPTGTMGNLIAVLAHCDRRGCEIIVGDQCHIFLYEQGGTAQFGGVHTRTVPNLENGTFNIDLVEQYIRPNDAHYPITSLITVENTHNMCGGKVLPMDWLNKLADTAQKYCIPIHMDGARIFNASVYLNLPVSKITERIDSVQFCFSKGLGTPAGSMLVGSKVLIQKARRLRKALGAGMRQSGVLAAPCIVALNSMVNRLADDHRRAREIAEAIDSFKCEFIKVDLSGLHTNILMVNFDTSVLTAPEFCFRVGTVTETEERELKDKCVVIRALGKSASVARLVLYHNITDEDIQKVIEKLVYIVNEFKLKQISMNA